jgi:hypothetical protein
MKRFRHAVESVWGLFTEAWHMPLTCMNNVVA